MASVKRKRDVRSKRGKATANPAVTPAKADPRAETAQRILVAEDSPVTQDLLKLVLEQRGHDVDLASDGKKALAALENQSYDVVLLDFHLPKMDGLEVASRFREAATGQSTPRFVAITADIKGLLSHEANCENFDEVIPKPFELEDVLNVVERKRDENEVIPQLPIQHTNTKDTGKFLGPLTQKYEFLRWPEDFNSERLSARGMHASLADGSFDAIVLNEPAAVRDLSVIWTTKTLHLLPVIDMTGSLPKQADIDGSKISIEETDDLDNLINVFHARRAEMHDDLIYTDDIGEKLIGRMFVSGGTLEARYDPASRELICYNTVLDFRSAEKEIKDLLARKFVNREFFDRFHVCSRCDCSHFNIREECVECGSSHLEEESYLHHFKCAYQGPESDFREDDDLVCPKCRMELSHFSVDYDKPGSMMKCQSCGHATSEPSVGFVCMECEAKYDGDTIRMRDVHSYDLTEQGRNFAKAGRVILNDNSSALRFAELPLELIVSMNTELKKYQADQTPFSLLNISYRNEKDVVRSQGQRMFARSRDLLLENFQNTARKEDCVVKGHKYDYVLLKGTPTKEVLAGLEDLQKETSNSLRVDLGVQIDVYGPKDFN
jgi:CheY-like chemotaxis protein